MLLSVITFSIVYTRNNNVHFKVVFLPIRVLLIDFFWVILLSAFVFSPVISGVHLINDKAVTSIDSIS